MMRSSILAFAVLSLVASDARSDSPRAAARNEQVFSPDRSHSAVSEVNPARTRVFAKGRTAALWEISGHHPVLFVANDGTHLVVGHPDGNLLPQNVRPTDRFLTFYSAGRQVAEVSVGDVFPDLSKLPRTVSHLAWGHYLGFEGKRFGIATHDGRKIFFDPDTGRPASSL